MYRAFSYSFAKSFPILSNGFEIETEMSIHAADKSFQVENVVVGYRDRPEGSQSKLNTVRDGIKVIRTIVGLTRDYRPMLFFGTIAIVLMLLAVLFFVPVLAAFLRTGMVGRIPTLLVCGFVFMAGMLSAVAGILLETIRQKDKRDFEFQLQQIEVNRKTTMEKVHGL